MKISQVVWMMIFTVFFGFSTPGVVSAQRGFGPPPPSDLDCSGCVGTTDIADGAVTGAKINSTQVQQRVTGSCAAGSSIAAINQNGTVVCETDDVGVTAVTASTPLVSSGSPPNISLPGVIIGASNTAVGTSALQSNTTGINNTVSGVGALSTNTSGFDNTASGRNALFSNTTGNNNTAIGNSVLFFNTTGFNNTASGAGVLPNNTTGNDNTASGLSALFFNTTGSENTAFGEDALQSNTTGWDNTALGKQADVASGNLMNATAIGFGAMVNASNKIRLGNTSVTVIEGQVAYTFSSDLTKKENFRPVNGEEVLRKIGEFNLPSWNFIGHDPREFRHYGPMAQDFFGAFGHDEVGTIGTPTTINSGDMAGILMIAVQALEKRTAEQRQGVEMLKTENAALKARVEALETLIREVLPHR